MTTILAIDSGNTFVKWGLFNDDQWIIQNSAHHSDITDLKSKFHFLSKPDIIIISHVGRQETIEEISKSISCWPIKPFLHRSNPFSCGVLNAYSNPDQLGNDRWASLIAAWNIELKGCLVVSAGTAVTVDALSDDGEFLGGIILPGIHLMHKSLLSHTQLNCDNFGGYENFPVNTKDAIYSGITQSVIGAIERMHHILSEQIKRSAAICIISGGDASVLHPFLIKFPAKIIHNLVLEGLVIVAKDELKKKKLACS